MFDWIYSNKEAFLVNYVDIGHSHSSAKKLQDEHHARTHNSNVGLQFIKIRIICFFPFLHIFFINEKNVRLGFVKFRFSEKAKKLQNEYQARTHNPNVGRIFTLKFMCIDKFKNSRA